MDPQAMVKEIMRNMVREGAIYKRSQFLKQWRQRWLVLTSNYLFTFKTNEYKDPTEVIDLRLVKSIKSYFSRGNQDMGHCGFKLISDDSTLYMKSASLQDKWKWLMILERTLELKSVGATKGLTKQKTKSLQQTMDMWTSQTEPKVLTPSTLEQYSIQMSVRNVSLVKDVRTYETTQTQTEDIVPHGFIKTQKKVDYRDNYQDNLSLYRGRMVRTLFDEYRYASNAKQKELYYLTIRQMLLDADEKIVKLLIVECKVHQIGQSFAQSMVQRQLKDVHSENEVLKNLRLLKLLKCDFADIYNKEYLDRIAYWIIQCLETYKKEGILLEAVQVLNGVMAVIEISQFNMKNLKKVLAVLERHSKDPQLLKVLSTMLI